MKEDILEQIAADYLNLCGYFTRTNIKYRPSESDPEWKGKELTGESSFEYWIVCTRFRDPECEKAWTHNTEFRKNLTPHLRIVSLDRIFRETVQKIGTTPANSELGRLIQLLKAANPDFVR